MFEAHITSARGSLFYVASATPYDLDTLRMHVRDFAAADDDVVVEVTVDQPTPAVTAVLQDLARTGVETRIRAGARYRSGGRRESGASSGWRRRDPLQR
jgi:hypothetical protein